MYARLVRFTFGPGERAEAQGLSDHIAPLIALLSGGKTITVFGYHGEGEYGIFVLWDSEANANTAAGAASPQRDQHLAPNVQGPRRPISSRSLRA
jgi:hypothetical protein